MGTPLIRPLILSLALLLCFAPDRARAKEESDRMIYRVVKGDNLYTLAERYFLRAGDYAIIQRLNRITNPRRLQIGTPIVIPRSLLRQEPVAATIHSFRGDVRIGARGNQSPATVGRTVREGDWIDTDRKSFVSLRLSDGSVITLPSQTSMRVERLRRTLLTRSIERSFRIDRGRAGAIVTPMKDPQSNFRLLTPTAVSAVRGTRFRMSYDPASGRTTTEVLEGTVGFKSDDQRIEQNLASGFGMTNMLSSPVSLLPSPELLRPAQIQDEEQLHFALKPLAEATGYRVEIASDAGFLDLIDETIVSSAEASLPSLRNGDYFVRVTALAADGLEGLSSTYAFRRQLHWITTSAEEQSVGRSRQYLFRWDARDTEKEQYRFQLSSNPDGSDPLIDEFGLTQTSLVLTDLPAGVYYWRVMTLDSIDGRPREKWSPFEELRVQVTK